MITKTLLFAFGLISLALFWVVFELRYIWGIDSQQLFILRLGLGLFALAILFLWVLYPSTPVVAALGLLGLLFPPIIDQRYVSVTLGFVPWILLVIGFLVATTELRRIQKWGDRLNAD